MAIANSSLDAFWCGVIESFGVKREVVVKTPISVEQCAHNKRETEMGETATTTATTRAEEIENKTYNIDDVDAKHATCKTQSLHEEKKRENKTVNEQSSNVSFKHSYTLMSAWFYLMYDPKLWKLMHKTLRANLLVAIISLFSLMLSRQLISRHNDTNTLFTSTTNINGYTATATATATINNNNNNNNNMNNISNNSWESNITGIYFANMSYVTSSPSYRIYVSNTLYFLVHLWVQWGSVFLSVLNFTITYGGQWPLYIIIQILGIVWYAQVYKEAWLLRKGFVFCNTRVSANTNYINSLERINNQTKNNKNNSSSAAESKMSLMLLYSHRSYTNFAGVLVNVLCRSCLLVQKLLINKKPPSSPSSWIIGNNKAAREAAQSALEKYHTNIITCSKTCTNKNAKLAKLPNSSNSTFNGNNSHLSANMKTSNFTKSAVRRNSAVQEAFEVISETIFKFVATFLFAYAALFMEWLIPYYYIGKSINFFMNTFLYTFYVFSYRFGTQKTSNGERVSLRAQLEYFERCWSYNLGYGCCTTLIAFVISAYVNAIVSMCFTCAVYAWHVMCSGEATPLLTSNEYSELEETETVHGRMQRVVVPRWQRLFRVNRLKLLTPWFTLLDQLQLRACEIWWIVCIVMLLYPLLWSVKCIANTL